MRGRREFELRCSKGYRDGLFLAMPTLEEFRATLDAFSFDLGT